MAPDHKTDFSKKQKFSYNTCQHVKKVYYLKRRADIFYGYRISTIGKTQDSTI